MRRVEAPDSIARAATAKVIDILRPRLSRLGEKKEYVYADAGGPRAYDKKLYSFLVHSGENK